MKPVGDRKMTFFAAARRMATAGEISVPQGAEDGTTPIEFGAPFLELC